MRQLRFYVPLELQVGHCYLIPEEKARHMIQVLRLSVGAEFVLFNGDGCEYSSKLTEVKKKLVSVNVLASRVVDRESKLKVHLLQGLSKGERMDATIQKCVELGVSLIHPINTSRSNLRLNEDRQQKKYMHWLKVIQSACEQSGRNMLPQLQHVNDFSSVVCGYSSNSGLKLILHPLADKKWSQFEGVPEEVVLLVGPEGGFGEDELELAMRCGFSSVSLGPRILRTETAAMTVMAGIQSTWGDI